MGANLPGPWGAPGQTLSRALERLQEALGPLRTAPLYRSPAVTLPGSPPQPDYLNTVAVGRTSVPPLEILRLAQELERQAGRDPRAQRWSARPLDVDLLVYGNLCGDLGGGDEPPLTLPHPRLRERAFVLLPLAAVAPDLPIPPDGVIVRDLLADLNG